MPSRFRNRKALQTGVTDQVEEIAVDLGVGVPTATAPSGRSSS